MIDTDLPRPNRTRWQPMRLGLVDLFLYDHMEFRFRDGHLLLRGNNGTGKSKVLALTLPFLLDGVLSPSRVEPDGDSSKRMDWNLLLGDRYTERLGYSWLEFGRRDETGAVVFVTIGCGLRAVSGRGIADHWFFVASGRIGVDFSLVGPTGVAHTRERLGEALEGIGHVYRRAEDYRRTIDERLFRLGIERYEALVNLLIQLRQPQLTRRPDEDRLSRALSEALRPVDQAILNVIAEAFHDLEQQRDELQAIRETHSDVDRFSTSYRRYAAVAARRLARDVRSSHSAYQASQRELAEVRHELADAEAEDDAAAGARRDIADELAAARGRAAELRDNREARDLDAAERLAQMAEQQAEQAAALETEVGRELSRHSEHLHALHSAAADADQSLRPVFDQVNRTASMAGLPPVSAELVVGITIVADPVLKESAVTAAERGGATAVQRRATAARHLRELIERAASAVDKLEAARKRMHEVVAERDTASDVLDAAIESIATSAVALLESWRRYVRSLLEIQVTDPNGVLDQVASWSETLNGPDPAVASISEAAEVARNRLSELRANALAHQQELTRELDALIEERDRLRRGEDLLPPQIYTRDAAARQSRDGAPLWQLVDFRPELPAEERAGLEAALEAAGILDAWVTPDGQLLAPDTHDAIVLAGAPLDSTSKLAAALLPIIDRDHPRSATVRPESVQGILNGIGLGASAAAHTWVDTSGRWHIGVLEGSWSKPEATFIGLGARDAARRQRLADLTQEIEAAQVALAAAQQLVQSLEARQRALSDEISRVPGADALRESHRRASDARGNLERSEARLQDHDRAVNLLAEAARSAIAARDEAALDLHLPSESSQLDAIELAILEYREATAGLWPRVRNQLERLGAIQSAQQQLEHLQTIAAERASRAEADRRKAIEERGRWEGLQASIGGTVEQIRSELQAVSTRIRWLEQEDQRLEEIRRRCANRIGRAQDSLDRLNRSLADQGERRAQAVSVLERFASNGLLVAAVPGLELPGGWSPDPVVRLARRIEQVLETTEDDESTWDRMRREIAMRFKELQDGMTLHGHSAILDPIDGWHVVTIAYHGQQHSPDALVTLLSDEIGHRERLLSVRERELLEEHLVNEIASHLQELIQEAEVQVNDMNEELRQRPTSTGMRLRFRWIPRSEGPAGLPEARARLMRQVRDAWSGEDRTAVSAFLKAQIDAVRAANESGTWLEHLTEAFDYRQWHRFSIERMQDSRWRPATGPASSGERVLTVTLPLFAAASAHYRSAHPNAPRLVLMDEVFAGVDDDSRAKSIGLLDTFDLDFVMTSEREWGCYATLPGLAIYQLARREGIDAVHVTAWTWDGNARARVEQRPAASIQPVVMSWNGISANGHLAVNGP